MFCYSDNYKLSFKRRNNKLFSCKVREHKIQEKSLSIARNLNHSFQGVFLFLFIHHHLHCNGIRVMEVAARTSRWLDPELLLCLGTSGPSPRG